MERPHAHVSWTDNHTSSKAEPRRRAVLRDFVVESSAQPRPFRPSSSRDAHSSAPALHPLTRFTRRLRASPTAQFYDNMAAPLDEPPPPSSTRRPVPAAHSKRSGAVDIKVSGRDSAPVLARDLETGLPQARKAGRKKKDKSAAAAAASESGGGGAAASSSSPCATGWARALFDYEPDAGDEGHLALRRGDVVEASGWADREGVFVPRFAFSAMPSRSAPRVRSRLVDAGRVVARGRLPTRECDRELTTDLARPSSSSRPRFVAPRCAFRFASAARRT